MECIIFELNVSLRWESVRGRENSIGEARKYRVFVRDSSIELYSSSSSRIRPSAEVEEFHLCAISASEARLQAKEKSRAALLLPVERARAQANQERGSPAEAEERKKEEDEKRPGIEGCCRAR